jgi:hypothetical protein
MGVGALKGSRVSTRDAKKAYIQSFIGAPGRPRTWVRLPKFLWPKSWFNVDGSPKYRDPVCILHRALYGHPESGPLWDKRMHQIMKNCGFLSLEGSHGFFYNIKDDAEMVVYVDDFVLISPIKNEAKIWAELDKHVTFKDPAVQLNRFLGVHHHFSYPNDGSCLMVSEASDYLKAAVRKYMKEAGVKHLAWVPSPSIDNRFDEESSKKGNFADTALSHLMKLLYIARLCRGDFITTVTFLARRDHFWSLNEDRRL